MKTLIKILSTLATLLVFAPPAWAQQYTVSFTTLNGAVTATQSTFLLTSASASAGSSFGAPAAGQCYFVDGEFGTILSMASTTATVRRANGGGDPSTYGSSTAATGHATGATIWTAPCNAFKSSEPPTLTNGLGSGNCNLQPAPWIDVKTANIWWCNTVNNRWWGTNWVTFAYGSVPTAQ